MSRVMQQRKCEICGKFFDVPVVNGSSGGGRLIQARIGGPWTCPGPHPDSGPGRRLERAPLANVLGRGGRRRG